MDGKMMLVEDVAMTLAMTVELVKAIEAIYFLET
jgi:hypothetical protein